MTRFLVLLAALALSFGAIAQPQATPGSDAMASFIEEASQAAWLQVGPADALDVIDRIDPFLLDVRRLDEYEAGHIEGAVLIPLAELDARKMELPADLDAPILVYCAVGIRGNFGLVYLKMLGYTNARNIRGGFGSWVDAGLPVSQ
jgi:rhodanese-related sulfurtransferase